MNEKYFVYVLQSERDKNIYIGITDDIDHRLKQHNAGSNLSTKHRTPFLLIHKEIFPNRIEARKREKFLKSGCGREWIREKFLRC